MLGQMGKNGYFCQKGHAQTKGREKIARGGGENLALKLTGEPSHRRSGGDAARENVNSVKREKREEEKVKAIHERKTQESKKNAIGGQGNRLNQLNTQHGLGGTKRTRK